jgi:hypothetical protein
MVFDFSKTCKTYDATSYKKDVFRQTKCPKCPAVGRFKLHGSYYRYVVYFRRDNCFDKSELVHEFFEIKRIRCISCKATHAVMPCDIIPYKLLTLLVVLITLDLLYLKETPVLKIAELWEFSHQFIYSVIAAFLVHVDKIYMYFRETSCGTIGHGLSKNDIFALIKDPYIEFQRGYLETNRRACFMCKFINRAGAPPMGVCAPLGDSNITFA